MLQCQQRKLELKPQNKCTCNTQLVLKTEFETLRSNLQSNDYPKKVKDTIQEENNSSRNVQITPVVSDIKYASTVISYNM